MKLFIFINLFEKYLCMAIFNYELNINTFANLMFVSGMEHSGFPETF